MACWNDDIFNIYFFEIRAHLKHLNYFKRFHPFQKHSQPEIFDLHHYDVAKKMTFDKFPSSPKEK